jgi:hypothetical protein
LGGPWNQTGFDGGKEKQKNFVHIMSENAAMQYFIDWCTWRT